MTSTDVSYRLVQTARLYISVILKSEMYYFMLPALNALYLAT
jgi:hypothetical protein